MNANKIITKIGFILIILLFILLLPNKSKATSSVNVSTNLVTVQEGKTKSVTLSSKNATGKLEVSASNDNVTVTKSNDWFENNNTITITVEGKKVGKANVSFKAIVADPNEKEITDKTITGEISVTVSEKESTPTSTNNTTPTNTTSTTVQKSNNANLKNLGITPNDFKGFKANTTAYNVTVPNDVEEVKVYATAQDSKATVKGIGKQKLTVGKNALKVSVTAEDGTAKTYTINVTRQEAKEEVNTTSNENTVEENNTSKENADDEEKIISDKDLINLEVKGYTLSPKFSSDVYEYTLDVTEDISNLEVITEGANHNVNVEVVGNDNLKDGENTISILVYNEETKNNSTYQITVNKTNIDLEGLNTTLNEAVKKANKIRYIIFGGVGFIIICSIIFVIVKQKYKDNDTYEKDNEKYMENLRETLNLDEEDELFSRVNQEKIEKQPEEDSLNTSFKENTLKNEDKVEDKEKIEENKEVEEQYFRTSKNKKKGKHF